MKEIKNNPIIDMDYGDNFFLPSICHWLFIMNGSGWFEDLGEKFASGNQSFVSS